MTLRPPALYNGEHGTMGHTTNQRKAGGARNDRPGRAETVPRGTLARGGTVPAEEGYANEPQGSGHLPTGFDRDTPTEIAVLAIYLQIATKKELTSGLEPLTCSSYELDLTPFT
jgi:hypothetical protein